MMPELPEVETVRRDLLEVLPGKRILTAQVFDVKLAKTPRLAEKITGLRFDKPQRQGKFLILPFQNSEERLVIHLRMTGQIIYRGPETVFASGHPAKINLEMLPDKHTRMMITLDDGGDLFFNDQRRFGTAEILSEADLKKRLEPFGVEPGSAQWDYAAFLEALEHRKAPIKAILLNQNLIFGIGNIYADETCFRARILPMRSVESLTDAEKKLLFAACSDVLEESIACRGTSIRDFVDTEGKGGGFAEKLNVYSRKGIPCNICGALISKVKCAGRGTYYCSHCQK